MVAQLSGSSIRFRRSAVFLDRDGVLNESPMRGGVPVPPASLRELRILPGVIEACARLRRAGFWLGVVTNQPDVRRGTQTSAVVDQINAALRLQLAVDDVAVCMHDDVDGCNCRKPAPGMLLTAAEKHGLDLARSFMVGDRWRDVEAGRRAGCRTILVDRGYDESPVAIADKVVSGLPEAVGWILSIAASGSAGSATRDDENEERECQAATR